MRYVEERTFTSNRDHELTFFDTCLTFADEQRLALKQSSKSNSGSQHSLVRNLSGRSFESYSYSVPPPKSDDIPDGKSAFHLILVKLLFDFFQFVSL